MFENHDFDCLQIKGSKKISEEEVFPELLIVVIRPTELLTNQDKHKICGRIVCVVNYVH